MEKNNNKISIGTWNVRFAPEVFETEDTEFKWEERRHELVKIIDENELDIIAVQECNQWQLSQIDELTHLEMKQRKAWAECFYPTFFVNMDRVKVKDWGDLWLSQTPDTPNTKLETSRWPRMLTWIKADIENISGSSLLINVHMDGEDQQQMRVFNELVTRLIRENNPNHVFISGDFNLSLRQFYRDPKGFYRGYIHHSIANTWNAHGRNPDQWDIDWILIDDKITHKHDVAFHKKEARITKNNLDFYISDHDLVVAEIKAKQM